MPDPVERLNTPAQMDGLKKPSQWPSVSVDALAAYSSSALKLVLPLIVTPLLTRRLDPTSFGWMAVMLSLAMTASLFVELGFGLSAARDATGVGKDLQARIVARVLSVRLMTGAILCLMSLAASRWLPFQGGIAASVSTASAILAFALGGSQAWYFQATGRLRAWSAIEIVSTMLGFLAFIVFAHDLASALWCYCAVYGIASALSIAIVQVATGCPSLGRARLSEGLRMTAHLAGFRVITAAYSSAVPAILAMMLPLPAVAAFHVADRIVRAGTAPLQPFTQIWFPRICSMVVNDTDAFNSTIRRFIIRLVWTGVAAAGAIYLLAKPLSAAIGGPALDACASDVLRVMVWLLPPLALSTVLGLLWLIPHREEKAFNFCVLGGGSIGLLLLLLLPRYFGAVGAASALLVGECCVTLAMLVLYMRRAKQ